MMVSKHKDVGAASYSEAVLGSGECLTVSGCAMAPGLLLVWVTDKPQRQREHLRTHFYPIIHK